MPRFVILLHEMPPESERPTHWDLMLEAGGALRTWALDEEPRATATIAALQLADHRLAYLDYEGPVSGNRGAVTRVAAGSYELLLDDTDRIVVRLEGEKVQGELELVRVDGAMRWVVLM